MRPLYLAWVSALGRLSQARATNTNTAGRNNNNNNNNNSSININNKQGEPTRIAYLHTRTRSNCSLINLNFLGRMEFSLNQLALTVHLNCIGSSWPVAGAPFRVQTGKQVQEISALVSEESRRTCRGAPGRCAARAA